MADNFNLRSFLTENKLTKNAQLLKEEESQKQEVYYDDILFNIQAKYPNLETAIQGVKQYLDGGNGLVTFDQWEKAEVDHLNFDGPCYFLVGPDEEPGQHPPLLVSVRDEDLITDPETVAQYKADDEAGFSDEDELDEEAPSSMQAGFDSVNLEKKKHAEMMRVANKLFPEFGGNLENFKPLSSQQRELVYQNLDSANLKEWSPYGSMAFSGDDKPKQREPKEGEVQLSTLDKGDVFKTADGSPLEFRVWGHNPTGGVDVQYTDYEFPRPNYTMRDDVMVIKLDEEVNEAKLTIQQLAKLKPGSKVTYLGKDVDGFKNGEQYEVSRVESSSTLQPTITIKNNDGKKLRTSNLSKIKETVNEAKSYKAPSNSKQAQDLKKGDIIGSGDEVVSVSAGAKTPAGKVEVTLKTKSGSTKTSTWGKTTKIGLKTKDTVKENRLTAKERRLVEMVNSAMREEENVDYTMGRQDDPNQLPNPAPELNIPEGDESIEEAKPLPKYNSIEELMKEIEHGTNEAAHKYKMEEMKRVYEALEAKVGSLEEGENAEHIDRKKVKQMRKDIAALRKAEERLRKDFDKKFSGKEKEAAPKKEKEAVALQEGFFDLRKFLAENRK